MNALRIVVIFSRFVISFHVCMYMHTACGSENVYKSFWTANSHATLFIQDSLLFPL